MPTNFCHPSVDGCCAIDKGKSNLRGVAQKKKRFNNTFLFIEGIRTRNKHMVLVNENYKPLHFLSLFETNLKPCDKMYHLKQIFFYKFSERSKWKSHLSFEQTYFGKASNYSNFKLNNISTMKNTELFTVQFR